MATPVADLSQRVRVFTQPVGATLRHDHTVGQALASLRQKPPGNKAVYFYVVDASDRLVGVVSTRALILAGADDRVERITSTQVVSVPADATLALAMELFAMHRLLALPVVEADGRLAGQLDVQLYTDEVFDLAETRSSAAMFQLIGLHVEQLREGSTVLAFRARLPWLACNLVGGVACAIIAAAFGHVLETVLILAMFIPLVLTLSESISIQAVTLGLAQLHGERVNWLRIRVRLTREWKTAAMLGATLGATVGVIALAWGHGWQAPAVIAACILASMLIAATLGTAVPAMLHAMRLDPRLAAGPLVLALTDIAAMTTYLATATVMLL